MASIAGQQVNIPCDRTAKFGVDYRTIAPVGEENDIQSHNPTVRQPPVQRGMILNRPVSEHTQLGSHGMSMAEVMFVWRRIVVCWGIRKVHRAEFSGRTIAANGSRHSRRSPR